MATNKALRAVRYLERCLRESGLSISSMVLFGSHARGEATEDSDVDVAVVSEDFRGKDILERGELVKDAHAKAVKKFMLPFDIVTLTPEELRAASTPVAQFASTGVAV